MSSAFSINLSDCLAAYDQGCLGLMLRIGQLALTRVKDFYVLAAMTGYINRTASKRLALGLLLNVAPPARRRNARTKLVPVRSIR